MRRFIMISGLVLSLLFANMLAAQGRRGQHQPPPLPNDQQIQKMVDELSQHLKLTDEQKTGVQKLFKEHFESVKKLQEQGRVAPPKMESLRKEFESKVKALLNEKQQKAFDKFMQKQGPKGRGRRRHGKFRREN